MAERENRVNAQKEACEEIPGWKSLARNVGVEGTASLQDGGAYRALQRRGADDKVH